VWQGNLALKNDAALVQMHFVSGNQHLTSSLPFQSAAQQVGGPAADAQTPVLRIAQRMRLEAQQLDGVSRRMQVHVPRD